MVGQKGGSMKEKNTSKLIYIAKFYVGKNKVNLSTFLKKLYNDLKEGKE